MYSHLQTTLPNGLRLVTVDIPYLHKVVITVFVKIGSAYEARKTNGLSHFLEHILLRGPKKYPSSVEFRQSLNDFGASLRAETFKEYTYFQLTTTPKYTEKALITLSEIFSSPRFSEKEIEAERQIILEEILEYQDANGVDIDVDEIASSLLWPNHPLGMKIQGTPENIKKFTISDSKAHFQKFFRPNNMVLCFAGKIENQEELKKVAHEHFSFLEGKAETKVQKILEDQKASQISFTKSTSQSQVDSQICFRALSHNHPQSTALEILNVILGGSKSSHLAVNLCERLGLVYEIYSVLSTFSTIGTLDINFSSSPEKLEKIVREILLEVEKIKGSISPEELSRAETQKERDILFSLDEPEQLSKIFGLDLLLGTVKTPEEKLEEIRKVTTQDIQSLAREVFTPQNLNLIVVGPSQTDQEEKSKDIVYEFTE